MYFPAHPPVLDTQRLRLRPFTLEDAPAVQRLAGNAAVAATTLAVPHPYPEGAAATWISTHAARWAAHEELVLAITLTPTREFVGAISLLFCVGSERADLGYWMGAPYWNRGYTTEAARAVVDYGFRVLQLNRIQAHHMAENPASGRVMEKIGMSREGCSPQGLKKNGRFHDLIFHGLLHEDWVDEPSRPDKALA